MIFLVYVVSKSMNYATIGASYYKEFLAIRRFKAELSHGNKASKKVLY